MIELLVILIVGLVVTAIVYYVAQALGLPHPIPLVVALVCVVVILIWAAGSIDTRASGRGQVSVVR